MRLQGSDRWPTLAMVAIAALALAACGGPTSSASAAPTTPSPQAPAMLSLEVAALPAADLDPATQTAICDPYPNEANEAAGESTVVCPDGIVTGLRALTAAGLAPIERLYLHRPTCRAIPCSVEELDTATVVGWTANGPSSVAIDSRSGLVHVSMPDGSIVWPAAATTGAPAVGLAPLRGAPAEIADRTPLPYCGRAEFDQPTAVGACFRESVLAGRPAEMLQRVHGIEGGDIDRLYRFEGRGAIQAYVVDSGTWTYQAGSMLLGITPDRWEFDPWPETSRVVPDS